MIDETPRPEETDRSEAMRAMLAARQAAGPYGFKPVLVRRTREDALARAERFAADPAEDPREQLHGVCVRDGYAWATDGARIIRIPLVAGVPEGFYRTARGWSEEEHDFPNTDAPISAVTKMCLKWIVDSFSLRILARLAIETAEPSDIPVVRIGSHQSKVLSAYYGSIVDVEYPGEFKRLSTAFSIDERRVGNLDVGLFAILSAHDLAEALADTRDPLIFHVGYTQNCVFLRTDGETHLLVSHQLQPLAMETT